MTTLHNRNGLKCLNSELPESWEAKLVPDDGRIYYVDHKTETSSWLPPRENWDPGNTGLPYGWEGAVDKNKKPYFINHVDNYTTRDDPRDDPDYVEPPKPREIELLRDSQKGFGFVAGSEKPVVVRFVTEGGPSVGKLLPGDQLIKINNQDVKKAPREYVIDLVRACKHSITLTVCQPYNDNSSRKSALLTAAKKDKLKKNPSRVRFAEEVIVNGASVPSNSPEESYVPFMPNVLKVFLENGQTKSFKYDSKTTVKDVLNSLQEKLNIKCVQHFNLVLHNMKSHMPGRMTLLQEHETVSEIACRPGARHFRCLFRVVYVPKDSYDLLKQDPIAFEYFYTQCVNDVLQERFANELKPDTILRLAALHIQQHAMSNNVTGKINIKTVEKEFGFEKFVPQAVRDNMRVKDLRKVLAQSLKMNQNLTAPGQKQLTALQAKLHYMKIVSELKTFGSRVFMVTLLDKKTEAMVLVGPKAGISLVTNVRFYTLSMLADFSEIQCIKVAREKENMNRIELSIKGDEPGISRVLKQLLSPNNNNDQFKTLNLGLLKEDAVNFVSMVNGYYGIFVDTDRTLIQKNAGRQSDDPEIPTYDCKHTVTTAPWSYPEDIVSMMIGEDASNHSNSNHDNERVIDLSQGPPAYAGNKEFISKLKQELGIKPTLGTNDKIENDGDKKLKPAIKKTDRVVSPVEDAYNVPMKTVITIEQRSSSPVDDAKLKGDKHDTDSITSSSSASASQASDQESEIFIPPKRKRRSPTPDARKRQQFPVSDDDVEYVNTSKERGRNRDKYSDEVDYVNSRNMSKLIENGENNSDTDSGVGGEAEKQSFLIKDSIPERSNGVEAENKDNGSELGKFSKRPTQISDTGSSTLPLQSELHLDLSSMMDPSFSTVPDDASPGSYTSPDMDSTSFVGQYDPDQLPPEVLEAVYDPRLFYNHEVYMDPDIIDLTMLQPFPPTEEELAEINSASNSTPKLPPSPRMHSSSTRHQSLIRTSTVNMDDGMLNRLKEEIQLKPKFHKSASVGYCPDFLDEDIDAYIDKLTVRPPPSVSELDEIHESDTQTDSDRLGSSWNGPNNKDDNGGLDFENPAMSRTIDLGALAHGDNFSALVIPPPPEESFSLEEISIVPPIGNVKDRRKRFERAADSADIYKKEFETKKKSKTNEANDGSFVSVNSKDLDAGTSQDSDVKGDIEAKTEGKNVTHTDSPASVSEKLNELLKSLSSFGEEEEEATGKFRRTSSLRLARCASLDFLNEPKTPENSKLSGLVTGSVRLKPKMRQSLSLDRQFPVSNAHIPLKSSSIENIESGQTTALDTKLNFMNPGTGSNIQRTHSYDVFPSGRSDNKSSDDDDESKVSESFASLKAKLQSYRDSLLNRSLRRKKMKDVNSDQAPPNEDAEQPKSSLSRSNSFTQLIRRSLRRSSKREENKEGRSSSLTREPTGDDKDDKDMEGLSARDRKIWNTLTTPRSNFRPNTGSSQSQDDLYGFDFSPELERLAPKPPLPVPVCSDKGEARKQKSGPLKALSNVFDTDKQPAEKITTNGEKATKRMAPEIPKSSPPKLTSDAETKISFPPPSEKTKTASPQLKTVSQSAPKSQTSASILTKPLSIPTAPPRRKHAATSKMSPRGNVSKDDSELNKTSSTKPEVKSPYSTVGKMWRPMSMSSSASTDNDQEDTYRTYNNFDALRDMSDGRMSPALHHKTNGENVIHAEHSKVVSNGHIGGKKIMFSSTSSLTVVKKSSKKGGSEMGSVSEKSFAVLREKVSASHTNTVKQIVETVYTSEDFVQATNDVDRLLSELKQTMESLKSSRIDKKPLQFDMCKDELQTQVRQFVTDAKLLVSNATQTKEKLAVNMNASMHSLAKIYLHGQATMFMMEAIHQAQHLGSEVMRVANAFKSTLNAAHAAVGKPLADPHMKYLMRQATNLATLLSNLLKSLKTLEQK